MSFLEQVERVRVCRSKVPWCKCSPEFKQKSDGGILKLNLDTSILSIMRLADIFQSLLLLKGIPLILRMSYSLKNNKYATQYSFY